MELLKEVNRYFDFVINDSEFVLGIDESGIYAFTRCIDKNLVLVNGTRLMNDLALTKEEVVLVIVSNEIEEIAGIINVVAVDNLSQFIEYSMKTRESLLTYEILHEIIDCYDEPDIRDKSVFDQGDIKVDYSNITLYKRLKKYLLDTFEEGEQGELTEQQVERLVRCRPSTVAEIQGFGVAQKHFVPILSLIKECPRQEVKLQYDPIYLHKNKISGERFTTLLSDRLRLRCFVTIAFCTLAVVALFLKLPIAVPIIFVLTSMIMCLRCNFMEYKEFSKIMRLVCFLLLLVACFPVAREIVVQVLIRLKMINVLGI